MRADRLLAVLMLVQARGRVTAAEVAAELEVSERTARRDLDALAVAGVPIYSRQGRNGGWELVGGARTDLTGLTAAEARALFLVAGPASSATPQVKAALRKLMQALPETFRDDAQAAAGAIVVDPTGWWGDGETSETTPALEALQAAVVDGRQVRLGYVDRNSAATTREVHPLGLAAKGPRWYLVADTARGLRTFRVDRVTSVELLDEPVVRPDGFDLAEAWRLVTERVSNQTDGVWVRALVRADAVGLLRSVLGRRLSIGPPVDGRVEVEVAGSRLEAVVGVLAGFGDRVEVVEPLEARQQLADIARQLSGLYAGR